MELFFPLIKKRVILFCYIHGFCLHVYMCTIHVQCMKARKGCLIPQKWSYRGLSGYWEMNLCPVQEQPVL